MDADMRTALEHQLQRQRELLFREVNDTEGDLQTIAEDRESEMEERAQLDRAARLMASLDIRGKHEIEEIDAALERLTAGTYGACLECGEEIPSARLRALPAARHCVTCAREAEKRSATPAEEALQPTHPEAPPPGFALMRDREAEASLWSLVHDDGRIDTEELRLVYRHGIVYLDGAVPSANEHQMLVKLIADVGGVREIVDRLQVQELLWERGDRTKKAAPETSELGQTEPVDTEDIVRSEEEGIEYVPPVAPPDEEQ